LTSATFSWVGQDPSKVFEAHPAHRLLDERNFCHSSSYEFYDTGGSNSVRVDVAIELNFILFRGQHAAEFWVKNL